MKQVTIDGMFPELHGGSIYKIGHGSASSTKPAISRAIADLLKQVKGKRISIIKATISIAEKAEE